MTTTTVKFTTAALENIAECGIDDTETQADVRNLSNGDTTEAKLLARCLDGADADRVEGWRDYVSAVALAAGATTAEKSVELTINCAPWSGEDAADHRVKVDFCEAEGPIVRVWDPVAEHYTRRHVLTPRSEARIAAQADEA